MANDFSGPLTQDRRVLLSRQFALNCAMAKPIRIYLDTSDYSRLLSPAAGSNDEKVKQKLFGWLDTGQIEIGISYWVVTEFIKDGDSNFREDRRAKGRLLKSFSRGNAFPHPIDIRAGATFPNDGYWVPRRVFKKPQIPSLKDRLIEKIKGHSNINRSNRRKLSSKTGIKEVIENLGNVPKLTREDYAPLPVSDEFLNGNYLENYAIGKISRDEYFRAFTKWLTDPEEYYDLWFSYAEKEDPIDKLTVDFHSKHSTIVSNLKSELENLKQSVKKARKARREYYNTLRKSDLPDNVKKSLPPIPNIKDPSTDFNFNIGQKLSDFFPEGQTDYIDEYLHATLDGRIIEDSDIIDLMHLQYIFYCDLIRCDDKTANLFLNSNSLPNERIVKTLADLPNRISNLLPQNNA